MLLSVFARARLAAAGGGEGPPYGRAVASSCHRAASWGLLISVAMPKRVQRGYWTILVCRYSTMHGRVCVCVWWHNAVSIRTDIVTQFDLLQDGKFWQSNKAPLFTRSRHAHPEFCTFVFSWYCLIAWHHSWLKQKTEKLDAVKHSENRVKFYQMTSLVSKSSPAASHILINSLATFDDAINIVASFCNRKKMQQYIYIYIYYIYIYTILTEKPNTLLWNFSANISALRKENEDLSGCRKVQKSYCIGSWLLERRQRPYIKHCWHNRFRKICQIKLHYFVM